MAIMEVFFFYFYSYFYFPFFPLGNHSNEGQIPRTKDGKHELCTPEAWATQMIMDKCAFQSLCMKGPFRIQNLLSSISMTLGIMKVSRPAMVEITWSAMIQAYKPAARC
jgi:hypothetical protein